MLRTELPKPSSSTELIRSSDQTTGRTMLWKSNPMDQAAISDAHQQSTQDGGNSSRSKVLSLSMNAVKSLMFMVVLMLKTEMFKSTTSMVVSTNNGTSSMLMNIQENQSRESSMKTSDCMLKDHSTSFLNSQSTDTLILSTIRTLLSRLETEERVKSGGSTKSH